MSSSKKTKEIKIGYKCSGNIVSKACIKALYINLIIKMIRRRNKKLPNNHKKIIQIELVSSVCENVQKGVELIFVWIVISR
jgi:hypothetical protein